MDLNGDGKIDLQDSLLGIRMVNDTSSMSVDEKHKLERALKLHFIVFMNRAIVITWPMFCLYLITQPWMANWTNNAWHAFSSTYDVYADNGSLEGSYIRKRGMCSVPASEIHCSDGQNFTELAIAARGTPIGCGCGEGVYGEGLCPMTFYGYTLSDFVSTAPALGAMLGLGFFPLLGTWQCTMAINKHCKPRPLWEKLHFFSMMFFQISYILWGVASDCIFPTSHAVLTVAFLGGFLAHWIVSVYLCIAALGVKVLEADIVLWVASSAISVITLGAIPRIRGSRSCIQIMGRRFAPIS
ncbi:unnamed protein product [Prorocentrum cordatum]|uniref:EF-hand domain-containing protein n=1 Tax=Prorocentrum cordatum TaxID=2364126 RepID=A0ABN9XG96_9DINO|nr:unnamed protein product [Polarella glacialis]